MNKISLGFPEIVQLFEIGKTQNGNPIRGIAFAAPSSILVNNQPVKLDSEFDVIAAADSRPSILIDGAHHARELTSISMVMYTMIRLLHGYLNSDLQINQILGTSGIYFVPIVNWDSVKLISQNF